MVFMQQEKYNSQEGAVNSRVCGMKSRLAEKRNNAQLRFSGIKLGQSRHVRLSSQIQAIRDNLLSTNKSS
jgi:hypothetical protein